MTVSWSSAATGASLAGRTVTDTIARAVAPPGSDTVYENDVEPLAFALGVNDTAPSVNVTLPIEGCVTAVMRSGSPSGSLSLASTGMAVVPLSSSTDALSSAARGARLPGGGGDGLGGGLGGGGVGDADGDGGGGVVAVGDGRGDGGGGGAVVTVGSGSEVADGSGSGVGSVGSVGDGDGSLGRGTADGLGEIESAASILGVRSCSIVQALTTSATATPTTTADRRVLT